MPTYDYRCLACAHRFEAFQSMTEPPLSECPNCGEPSVERLISAGSGLLFKGSGFYITDYRKDSYKQDAKKESPDSGKPKTDSAPKPSSPPSSDKTSSSSD